MPAQPQRLRHQRGQRPHLAPALAALLRQGDVVDPARRWRGLLGLRGLLVLGLLVRRRLPVGPARSPVPARPGPGAAQRYFTAAAARP
ncbi:hypothetical protein [Kineococcus sp. G2]|uniref:hypothetical protein n=1 Tax=Kineococcus sp. G2 TaxID=3127484 RepID=UPI00301E3F55